MICKDRFSIKRKSALVFSFFGILNLNIYLEYVTPSSKSPANLQSLTNKNKPPTTVKPLSLMIYLKPHLLVIRFIPINPVRPINLFTENHLHQLMRECHL